MEIKNGLEIVPCLYDVNTVEYAVKDIATGRYIVEGCETVADAEIERDIYLDEMHSFNAGPFAS